MDIVKEKKEYSTSDLSLAAALVASGAQVKKLEWEGGRAFFVFGDSCTKKEDSYWAGTLMVSARAYVESFRMLKDRVMGVLRNSRI